MTDTPARPLPDRSLRLRGCGALAVLAGLGVLGLAALEAALPFVAARLAPDLPPPDARSAAAGALVFGLAGAVVVLCGLGSLGRRRWVGPVMLTVAWSWLLAGVLAVSWLALMLDELLVLADAGALPGSTQVVLQAVLLGGATVAGVLLPALFVWAYRDPAVLATCARAHPADWSDRVPPPVLGLALCLFGAGLAGVPFALQPAVPWFGRVLTGRPALLLTLASSVVSGLLGLAVYRQRRVGFWGSLVFLGTLGVSTTLTFALAPPQAWAAALGPSAADLPLDSRVARAGTALSLVLTLATAAWLGRLYRHFRQA